MNEADKYQQSLIKVFKKLFSGTIKETFLGEMVNRITNDFRYVAIFLKSNDINKMLSMETIAVGRKFKEITVPKMIVMVHYLNAVSLSDADRGKIQSDETYKKKLTNEVINMLAIEKMTTSDYSDTAFEAYLPIIYYVAALNNYLGNKYDEIVNQNSSDGMSLGMSFKLRMLYKFIMRVKSCVSLADLRATDELMIIYRTTIELFMSYALLWDENDGVIESFYIFDEAASKYNYDGTIPENIVLQAKDSNVSEVKFVNYGWIKNLKEFKTISNKRNIFSVSGLSRVLDIKYKTLRPYLGSDLYKFYKSCNPQTHGTMLLMNYLQLEIHIFQNIAAMLNFICNVILCNISNFNYKITNVDLFEEIDRVIELTNKTLNWLEEDDKNLTKTNLDYRERALCIARMKSWM